MKLCFHLRLMFTTVTKNLTTFSSEACHGDQRNQNLQPRLVRQHEWHVGAKLVLRRACSIHIGEHQEQGIHR